jgi:hypothetical protein
MDAKSAREEGEAVGEEFALVTMSNKKRINMALLGYGKSCSTRFVGYCLQVSLHMALDWGGIFFILFHHYVPSF